MPNASRGVRLLLLAALALLVALLLWALFGALRGGIALWQQWRELPLPAQYGAAVLFALALIGLGYGAWRVLSPRPRKAIVVAAPKRADIDTRIDSLTQQRVDTASLQSELAELDR